MEVLLVRHAIAEDRARWAAAGRADDARPLTSKGRSRMKRACAGLETLLPGLDLIATSPLERAAATAAILARSFPDARVAEVPSLAPGGPRDETLAWLARRRERRVALVGHEPDLGALAAWLIAGDHAGDAAGDDARSLLPALPMRKGGACLLRFASAPRAGSAELRWFLPPSLLRRLAR